MPGFGAVLGQIAAPLANTIAAHNFADIAERDKQRQQAMQDLALQRQSALDKMTMAAHQSTIDRNTAYDTHLNAQDAGDPISKFQVLEDGTGAIIHRSGRVQRVDSNGNPIGPGPSAAPAPPAVAPPKLPDFSANTTETLRGNLGLRPADQGPQAPNVPRGTSPALTGPTPPLAVAPPPAPPGFGKKPVVPASQSDLSPQSLVVNGQNVQGFRDKHGQYYDDKAVPIPRTAKVTTYAPPVQPTIISGVDPATQQPYVYRVPKESGAATPVEGIAPKQGTGGSTGSQTSVADMEQRLGEIKTHATNLAAGKGEITRAMQVREGLEYGIANASAGGHGVPIKDALTAGAMDLGGIGGGPDNQTYQEYAALMNSQRALGDDVAKVFKGRQNEDAVKREIALASLNPGDYKNPQVVSQKLSRLQNIIDLAKVTQPKTGSAATPTPTAGGKTVTINGKTYHVPE